MFEVKVILISSSEMLFGTMLDTGEMEVEESMWVKFTRFRLGLIFFTLDFTYFTPKF
jgi:hypothetical protein